MQGMMTMRQNGIFAIPVAIGAKKSEAFEQKTLIDELVSTKEVFAKAIASDAKEQMRNRKAQDQSCAEQRRAAACERKLKQFVEEYQQVLGSLKVLDYFSIEYNGVRHTRIEVVRNIMRNHLEALEEMNCYYDDVTSAKSEKAFKAYLENANQFLAVLQESYWRLA